MWCSPCAPLRSSSCSVQRDTLQFAYPVPSRCLLRARRLQHSDSVSPSSPASTLRAFLGGMKTGLFSLCSDGEAAVVLSLWSFLEEDIQAFSLFLFIFFLSFFLFFGSSSSTFPSRLVFQQKCGTRVQCAASAECSPRSWPLDWRGIPAPFSSPAPWGTRGVCMQTVVYHGKVREAVSLWLFFFFFFLRIMMRLQTE